MKLKRRNFFLEIILGIIVIYVSVLVILFIFQRTLMYHPSENNYADDEIKFDYGEKLTNLNPTEEDLFNDF